MSEYDRQARELDACKVTMQRPRNPGACNSSDNYIVAVMVRDWSETSNGTWRVVETHLAEHRAFYARDVLEDHERRNGRDSVYRVFRMDQYPRDSWETEA